MMRKRHVLTLAAATLILGCACMIIDLFGATKFRMTGRIESRGKGDAITLLLYEKPVDKTYYIIRGEDVCGTVEILSVVYDRNGQYKFRAAARYTLTNQMYAIHIRAGADIALVDMDGRNKREYTDQSSGREPDYRRRLVVPKDGREMMLVPEGKFVFGSNTGDRDESPEQILYLDNFYIDKYEVSNDDFLAYIRAMNVKPPASWEGGMFRDGCGSQPVLVTYYEAETYARWSGKRLPTEEEWEKAARGQGRIPGMDNAVTFSYPWGTAFDPERANCADLWIDDKTGAHLKLRYSVTVKGLMPVTSFDPEGASPYGVINMSGNAREWTASWYLPYKGGSTRQGTQYKKYGKQYKVVRGGAWYSSRYELRVSNRETGGAPSLRSDNMAGFRCAKSADPTDQVRE
jgi:formylglycine-generating enzyme required for sulfatase activity